jgi:purine-binding chemotaxis protein CheW
MGMTQPAIASTTPRQWVAFGLGREDYAVTVSSVQEIIRLPAITPVPSAPSHIEGVINLRGRILPIMDLGRRLGLEVRPRTKASRVIVASAGGRLVGLLVDAVREVIELTADDIDPAADVIGELRHAALFLGVARRDDRLLLALDLDRVVESVGPSDDLAVEDSRRG